MRSPPRLLYLSPGCFDKGGISRYNRFQIQAFREILGRDNVAAYSLLPPKEDNLEQDFEVAWAPQNTHGHRRNKLAFAAKVAARAMTWRPDLIWTAHVNMAPFASALGKTVHANTVLNTYGLEVWSGLSRRRLRGLKAARCVISDCGFTARYLEEEGLRPPGSVRVVWDTVDVERFYPAAPAPHVFSKYGIPDPATGINVLTLGRMTRADEYKGYGRLLEAFAVVARDLDDIRLIYAGSGDLRTTLSERAAQLGLSDRVCFTGSVHEADLPDVYRCAHIFALITDRGVGRGEGIPVTPLEAAACGIPILVGNQDGSVEAVIEGENGRIFDPFDIEGHAAAIKTLVRSSDTRLRMGQAAAARIQAEFSYEKFREKHREILESIEL
jgi:phosphatidylinositol alpha-1,6-mannosyltransferase